MPHVQASGGKAIVGGACGGETARESCEKDPYGLRDLEIVGMGGGFVDVLAFSGPPAGLVLLGRM